MSADIGKSIKQIREQRDLNQRELAKYAGISNVTVCKIEQGVLTPSLKTTIRITNVLQCSLDDLCGRSQPTVTRLSAGDGLPVLMMADQNMQVPCLPAIGDIVNHLQLASSEVTT